MSGPCRGAHDDDAAASLRRVLMRRIARWTGALCMVAGMHWPALAAPPVTSSTPVLVTETPTRAPAAIAVADIPLRADTDERFAEGVVLRAGSEDATATLAPRLEAIA
jgi:hypothetical protein